MCAACVCAVYMTYTLRADRHVCLLVYRGSGSVSTGTTARLREKKENDIFTPSSGYVFVSLSRVELHVDRNGRFRRQRLPSANDGAVC